MRKQDTPRNNHEQINMKNYIELQNLEKDSKWQKYTQDKWNTRQESWQ